MARKRRLHKRYGRKRRSEGGGSSGGFRANPPLLTDLAEMIGPGFVGFAATRFLTRVASVQLAKRKPSWGKHAGAITSIATFLGAWWGAGRWKYTAKYSTPIVVGSAIAAIQSIIQLYIPKVGWLIADASPEIDDLKLGDTNQIAPQLPADLEYVDDDPNEYTYNDAYDPGRYAKEQRPAGASPAASKAATDDAILNDLGLNEDDLGELNLGSLGG